MREVSGPILATALVLGSVFIPTAFISGLTGRFYQQFALTIAISTMISAFNSLTLSPALAALLLKRHEGAKRPGGLLLGWFFAGFNYLFRSGAKGYVGLERRAIRVAVLMLGLYVGLLLGAFLLFRSTPTAFVPQQDKGFLIAIVKLPDGAALDRTEAAVRQMSDIALNQPGVKHVVAFTGMSPSFSSMSNFAIAFIGLDDYDKRRKPELTGQAIAGVLSGKFAAIPDAFAFTLPPPPVLGIGLVGGFELYLEDRGNMGLEKLNAWANQVKGAMSQSPMLDPFATRSFFTMDLPSVELEIDREALQARNVRMDDVYDALQGQFGSVYVNDFTLFNRNWQVTMQNDASHRMSTDDIRRIKVRSGAGGMVPLSAFVKLRDASGPSQVNGYNTFSSIDISGGARVGVSGDQGMAAMRQILDATKPPGGAYEWTGLTYQQILAGNTAYYIYPICVLLVVLVLAAFYESLVLPLAIVLIVPTCLLAALIGVRLTHNDNNIMTQIGLIVLVGLACKNAILIVEFAKDAEVLHGLDPVSAAIDACRKRLRPILMTSIAFIMGVWPLVSAHGAGAELRRATGVAVFAGMIGVTLFGLLLTPVFYVVLRRLTGNRPLKRHSETD
jgi:hydrophobe/amphiphile efflux-1 (HAE1) family protein